MKFIADLPIHSHYSRSTSKNLIPERLAFWAQKKGITLEQVRAFFLPLADQGRELKTRFKKSTLENIFRDKGWTIK